MLTGHAATGTSMSKRHRTLALAWYRLIDPVPFSRRVRRAA